MALRRPSRGPSPELVRRRARGALLGLAAGDALGTTLEFKPITAPPFPERCPGPHRDIIGKGPFNVVAGQVTDDTQMACALAQSLRTLKRFDAQDVLARYRAWRPHAFDIGQQTAQVLDGQLPNSGPFHAALTHWEQQAKRPAGNGSLMRTAPIGVLHWRAHAKEARLRASLEDSALTHADPRCQLACAALNAALAAAVACSGGDGEEGPVNPKVMFDAARTELRAAAAQLGRTLKEHVREVQAAALALQEDLTLALAPDPRLYGPEIHLHHHQGFVRVAFRLAFWELHHATSFEEGLVDVVNRGGDADTNGAIAGALLGAAFGEAAIPKVWRSAVLEAVPRQAALREVYHPVALLPLAELAADQ